MLPRNALLCLPWIMSFAAATCWKSGANADQKLGKDSVKSLAVVFQGYYADRQMRYACLSDYASGNSYIYTLERLEGKGGATLDIVKINDWLWREANSCRYGGKSTHESAWTVNVNAVPGVCIDKDYLNKHPETMPPS